MTDETLRWRGGWARLGSWRGRADVAYLSVGAEHPPTPEIVDRCLRMLRGRGYSTVVTSALAAADAVPFLDAGFSVRERLHLLAHPMSDLPQPGQATRRARKGDRAAVLELDHLSFDGFWRLDADGLTNAIEATPSSRFRVAEGSSGLLAYAVTGRAAPRSPSRRAPRGLRPGDRPRRPPLVAPARCDPRPREHPARQRARAGAVRVVRIP